MEWQLAVISAFVFVPVSLQTREYCMPKLEKQMVMRAQVTCVSST